ncbi:MAG: enoyl-CoA hydratase/isomerase family protein [Leptospiraceae bacterium]|nr:enoyl-CoA hydratase/isomerase family protein [Leptospiraceae bacterium]
MEEIKLDISNDGIATLTFNRPQKSNSISRALLNSFQINLQKVFDSEKLRVLIIKGEGEKAFCAGADLEERKSMSEEDIFSFLDQFRDTLLLLEEIPIPTISAINGAAFGGGLEIALACDIRLMKSDVFIGLTETKLGIIPGAGGTQRLSRIAGISNALSLIYRGKKMNAEEALKYGVVNEVFEASEYFEKVKEFINEIISSAPIAVRLARKAIRKGYFENLQKALDTERDFYKETLKTKDRLEALNAFKEKRKPDFKGE